ncbi:hypothetical protein E2C01_014526 [Portunus trituberculatus]|uniref:Uncharacterized protein n=1 Tax=Portunus trituberculatus TaxID=210409 RepID=A0A5B7DJG9_PORTR|nr:hypothetical protein [Portunus trituberculatus]
MIHAQSVPRWWVADWPTNVKQRSYRGLSGRNGRQERIVRGYRCTIAPLWAARGGRGGGNCDDVCRGQHRRSRLPSQATCSRQSALSPRSATRIQICLPSREPMQ